MSHGIAVGWDKRQKAHKMHTRSKLATGVKMTADGAEFGTDYDEKRVAVENEPLDIRTGQPHSKRNMSSSPHLLT